MTIWSRSALSAVLIATLPSAALAQQGRGTCLTSQEAEGLVTYALPATVRAMSRHCAKSLPATAALVQAGTITAARYQVDADTAWPLASKAFDKVSGLPVATLMGEKALKPLIEETISGGVTQNLKPKDCVSADRLINLLAPLPTRNMAGLLIALVEISGPAARAKLPINICPPPLGQAATETSGK